MEFEQAKRLLLLHSQIDPDTDHPIWVGGFLGSLRPFQGLNEENLDEVMAAIVAVAPHLLHEPHVDREVVSALWSLVLSSRWWGLHPNGMLQRNGFLRGDELERFEGWVEAIEWAVLMLLGSDGRHPDSRILEEALASYRQATGRDFPPER